MKRKIFSVLFALVLVLSFSLVTAVPAGAQDGVPDRETAITRTADRLVALQGTDGGWDWVVTGLTAHSGGTSASNLYGVTALGLLDAYEVTGNEAYKTAAQLTADHLKTLSRATDSAVRFYSFDYRFLVESSALFDDPSYEAHALSEWNWVKANSVYCYADGNQEQYYQWCIKPVAEGGAGVSPGYATWSIGDIGLAALAMDDTSWASNMADVLAVHLPDITSTDDWRFIGWGKALELLNAVDSTTYATEIDSLIDSLTLSQSAADGNWLGTVDQGAVQNTAYAIMGVAAVDEADAARRGAAWLVANQISTGDSIGGWVETDAEEYSENDSEVLQALASVPAPVTIGDLGYYSIQSAIDAAQDFETISVAAGTYAEAVNIYKDNLVVESTSGADVTTITASSAVATVDFIGPESGLVTGSVLDGFTVINEFMDGPFPVVVRFQYASGCVAKNCVIIGPSTDTGPHMSGVVMSGEHNATVNNVLEKSTISSCWNGFVVFGPGADGNIVRNNTVEGNSNGAWIENQTANTLVEHNTIRNNILLGIGIDEQWWGPSVNIQINYNNIYGNGFGIKADYQSLTTPVNATNNWWGNASGPTHASNTSGTGNPVTDNVAYSPWLGATIDVSPMTFIVDDVGPEPAAGYIQTAIDAASDDDTVIVAEGIYSATIDNSILLEGVGPWGVPHGYCFVHIDKTITLVGESRDGVILDGTALQSEDRCTGIWVSVSNVKVKNLTIQNFKNTALPDTACYGLYVMEKFRDYTWENVALLQYVTAENIKVANNTCPIYFMKTEYATVKDCVVDNNLDDGIWVSWGSDYATVQGNTVTNAGDHGIWVGQSWMGEGHGSNNATIKGNSVNGTREAGISFVASDGAIISGNTITNAAAEHPSVGGWSVGALSLKDGCSNVEAFNNNIYNNDGSWGGHNGTGHGVGIDGTPSNINLYFNNIYGNTGDGCHNYSTVAINATMNWWGGIGGPGGEGLGNGNSVSADVLYDPWLTEDYDTTIDDGIAYFGSTIPLEAGWNTLSVPLKLKDSANTMSEIVALGDFLISSGTAKNWEIAYQYDPESPAVWQNIGTIKPDIELVPGRGYYIKILGTDTVDFPVLYSGILSLPAFDLDPGWNLIGSGFGIDKTGGDYGIAATNDLEDGQKDVATALYSIKDTCSVVVSPSTQGQVAAWGTTVVDDTKNMIVGEAYWVFMTAPATLAGFEVTPIYYLP